MRSIRQSLEFLLRVARSEQVIILVAAALVGAFAACGAIVFRSMIMGAGVIFYGAAYDDLEAIQRLSWYSKLLTPALGALILAPIVVKLAPEVRGSGIPEVIESVASAGGSMRKRVAPLKALASAICIGSGGSAGREGPIVHIGAALGSWLGQTLRMSVKQVRTLLGCGVAGGIAATFNTPFAGALFAVEVVLGDFGTAKISPIVVASVVATVISRHYTEAFPQIVVPSFGESITLGTVHPYIGVGVACAIVSAFFIYCLRWSWKIADRWKWSPYFLPVAGGLFVGATALLVPQIYGVGYETINNVLQNKIGIGLLLAILLTKILATSATLGSGGSGGVFAPSLFLGAVTGSLVGLVTEMIDPNMLISPHAYALVGMGAMVAGTTRAPISAVLVIFEMTRDYNTIIPLMAACIPAVLISATLQRDSIYIAKLTHRGVNLRTKNELNVLKGLHVSDVMSQRLDSVPPETQLTDLVDKFLGSHYTQVWMTDSETNKLLGVIEAKNFQIALLEREALIMLILAQDVAGPVSVTTHPEDDLSLVMRLFEEANADILPVIDRETGILLGDLMRSDVIEAYNRELAQRDVVNTAIDSIHLSDRLGEVDIGDGYAIVEYEVPKHLEGKTLIQLDLRRQISAQVLIIKRHGKREVPGPQTALKTGDILLLAGEKDVLEKNLRKI